MIKQIFSKLSVSDVVLFCLALALSCILVWLLGHGGDDGLSLATTVLTGAAGGKHLVDGPLTTAVTDEVSPGLLRNEIDSRVVRIRPMSTPIDQISRWTGARHSGSMKVEFYSVDTKPASTTILAIVDDDVTEKILRFKVKDSGFMAESETILFPGILPKNRTEVVGYVSRIDDDGVCTVKIINVSDGDFGDIVDRLDVGNEIVRMGRAATELDVQTAQFEAIPVKDYNLCQIFKAQVEQSTYQKIAHKEVGWTFSDQEEVAIIDMRLGMEKNFLFGQRARFEHPLKHEDVLLTGGIWNQAGNDWSYSGAAGLNHERLVSMMRAAFTQNCGSSRKILVAGSGLIERLNNLEHSKVIDASTTVTRWGIDFTELHSKFGSLYVVHSEVFDTCGHCDDGLIVDPEYITKYSHLPFRTERLDLKKSGLRNTEAVVITEASCLVLRYPRAHTRVVMES